MKSRSQACDLVKLSNGPFANGNGPFFGARLGAWRVSAIQVAIVSVVILILSNHYINKMQHII